MPNKTRINLFTLLLLAAPLPALAQSTSVESLPAVADNVPNATVTATIAPQEVREVVATGKAAFGTGGVLGARRAATAQALRNAVEKALGVYVSARSLTQNYVLVRDQVLTRADGFATLKEVIKEEVGTEEVSVTVRALVTLKPLAEQLKALKLTRAFRLFVQSKRKKTDIELPAAPIATLQNKLAEAGFVVVDSAKEADLLIKVSPRFTTTHETPLDTAAGPMTMYAIDAQVTVQAVRVGTGEIVAAFTGHDTANHVNVSTARDEAAGDALAAMTPHLLDSLMVLPAAQSQPVTLVVSHLHGAVQVGKLEEALERLNGVQKVTRRSYTAGTAAWEMDVLTDLAPNLARDLEESPTLRPFRLTVTTENRAKIVATNH